MTEKQNQRIWRELKRLAVKLAVFAGSVWAVFSFVLGGIRISENNMFPMVKAGDFCLYYRLGRIAVGDLVFYQAEDGRVHAGRVAAAGGQTVDFPEEGGYTVDGSVPYEYLPYETGRSEESSIRYPLTLQEKEYFILNDFRGDDSDSRKTGPVPSSRIKGKALFIFRRRSL